MCVAKQSQILNCFVYALLEFHYVSMVWRLDSVAKTKAQTTLLQSFGHEFGMHGFA